MDLLQNPFYQFAAILGLAAVGGAVGQLLRQPLIVMFIAVGVAVGPAGLGVVQSGGGIDLLARMGIAVLLFLVGLRLDVHSLRTLGPVALAVGLGQVAGTAGLGYLLARGLGLAPTPAGYVALAVTFSSTIIVVKLLSDKREIDALHGRIAVGVLIVQDLAVILVMIGLSAGGAAAGPAILAKGAALLGAAGVLARYALPPLARWLARSPELLVLSALAWAITLAAAADALGFSKEVGAFVAGVTLASTPFRESIGGRLAGLRDFLLLFFFIELGAGLDLAAARGQLAAAAALTAFVVVGKPLLVLALMGAMGYRKRTGFLTGAALAQVSEFSLILAGLGVALGHLTAAAMGLITLVALATIGLSSYLILYSHPVYERVGRWLGAFERPAPFREGAGPPAPAGAGYVLFGLGRFGHNLARSLRHRGEGVLGVDFDPDVIAAWHRRGHPAQYGDAEDPELAASLPLADARWVVCTAPRRDTNAAVLRAVREAGYAGRVALTAHHADDADYLRGIGADLVLLPFVEAAKDAAAVLADAPAPAAPPHPKAHAPDAP